MKRWLFIILAIAFLWPLPAGADRRRTTRQNTNYFVDDGGLDTNTGRTPAHAWATLQHAADTAKAGDTVWVRNGDYAGVDITTSGDIGKWITYRNYPGEVPRVKNTNGDTRGFDLQGVHHIRIEGFHCISFTYDGIHAGWTTGCEHLEFRYNICDDNGATGIGVYNSNFVLIENNLISRNGYDIGWASGIDLWTVAGKQNVVRGNVIFNSVDESVHHTDGNALTLDVSGTTGGALFENNIAFHNGGAAMAVTSSDNVVMRGNTFYKNWQDDRLSDIGEIVFAGSCDHIVMRNNLLYSRITSPTLAHAETIPVSETVNNLFYPDQDTTKPWMMDMGDADFRLRTGSPATDAGSASGAMQIAIGFDFQCISRQLTGQRYDWWHWKPDITYIKSIGGLEYAFSHVARPQDSDFDIGAWEGDEASWTGLLEFTQEDGDLSEYDYWNTNDIVVTTAAGLNSTDFGLAVTLNNANDRYVRRTTSSTSRLRIRIYVDPVSTTMVDSNDYVGLIQVANASDPAYYLYFGGDDGTHYAIDLWAITDAAGWEACAATTGLSDVPHYVEIDLRAATGVGQNDGFGKLWVDGAFIGEKTNLDNDVRAQMEKIYIGALSNQDVTGTYYLDEIRVNTTGTEIGS